MSFAQVESRYLRLLLAWGAFSIITGGAALLWATLVDARPDYLTLLGAAGTQFVIWGLIDAILAMLALRGVASRRAEPLDDEEELLRQQRLMYQLRFNGWLDYLYVSIGLVLGAVAIMYPGPSTMVLLGNGIGVVCQGAMLLIYDGMFQHQLQRTIPLEA